MPDALPPRPDALPVGSTYDGNSPLPVGFTDDHLWMREAGLERLGFGPLGRIHTLAREAEAAGRQAALAELREKVEAIPAVPLTSDLLRRGEVLALLPTPEPTRE